VIIGHIPGIGLTNAFALLATIGDNHCLPPGPKRALG
jgi:hypothetical protein